MKQRKIAMLKKYDNKIFYENISNELKYKYLLRRNPSCCHDLKIC